MDILLDEQELSQLLAQLEQAPESARLPYVLALAWHYCERDTSLALEYCAQAEHLTYALDINAQFLPRQRIKLIRAKAALLSADLCSAAQLSEEVIQSCDPARIGESLAPKNSPLTEQDWLAAADGWHLQAMVASERGQANLRATHWQRSADLAQMAGDALRTALARVYIAYRSAQPQASMIEPYFGPCDGAQMADLHPGLVCWLYEFWGLLAFQSGDFGNAILRRQRAHEYALASGQFSRAIISALSIGVAYANLNDHDMALKWKQTGLALAHQCGWPGSIGVCLVACGETLRMLRQFQAAREVLHEAFFALQTLKGSHNYALALRNRGFLALDEGDYVLADQCFRDLIERACLLQAPDFEVGAYRGIAHTLSALQQPTAALKAGMQALQLALQGQNKFEQVEALLTLAHLHHHHKLDQFSTQAGENWLSLGVHLRNPRLHYLLQALELSERIEGHVVSGELLDALADTYAEMGDFCTAYRMAKRAAEMREKTHGIAATNRAIAMQVQFQTELSQADKQYHQQLAQAEARRAEVLQQTSNTLAHLGAIGQEVTAHLDAQAIFQVLHRHLQSLLDITAFGIYFLQTPENILHLRFAMENGQLLPAAEVALDHPTSFAARCARERREILFELPNLAEHHSGAHAANANIWITPGTLLSLSCVFAPLVVAERIIGVMSMQSVRQHAFGERERLIFRTLCAYGAIAFDNANAYQRLQQTKVQLVAQEKLAALGSLVAGVAHELNTPLGNSILMASALQLKVEHLQASLAQQDLRHAQLCEFLDDADHAARLISRNLGNAACLVSSFKQVAVDRTSEQKRDFELRQTCQELVATMLNQIRQHGHQFTLDIHEGIMLHSYPGPLGQVIGNLINNALQHAFPAGQQGQIHLRSAQIQRDYVQLRFSDDGCGIADKDMKRIFDPFFTTGCGMGGLGLSTSHNIVTSILGGRMRVESRVGQGSCFILELPARK